MSSPDLVVSDISQIGHLPVGPDGLPRASEGPLFKDGFFGRDAITVALHEMHTKPEIAKNTILALASLQGTKFNVITEEEIGKIHHEFRTLYNPDGTIVSLASQEIFSNLKSYWGEDPDGKPEEFIYYGTADATPAYLVLINKYIQQTGDMSILSITVRQKDGKEVTVLKSALSAVDYVLRKINESEAKHGISLYGFHRLNPNGISFQSWLDGSTSYMHEAGELANSNDLIYDTAIQGLVYDALLASANLVDSHSRAAEIYQTAAANIQRQTLDWLWMPNKGYFVMGLDFDPQTGEPRQIQTLHANVAELLNTQLFDSLSENERRRYIGGIVRTIISDEFLTDVGIRCRAFFYKNITSIDGITVTGYQSAGTSWFKQTADIAEGLLKQGFYNLAHQLFLRLVNTVRIMGVKEFVYLLDDGIPAYNLKEVPFSQVVWADIIATNNPEDGQAWTKSAYDLAILRLTQTVRPTRSIRWQEEIDDIPIKQVREYSLYEINVARQSATLKICLSAGIFYEQKIIEANSPH